VQQIWTVKPDGSDLKQLTDQRNSGILFPVWSPDGSRMAAEIQLLRKIVIFDPRKSWIEQPLDELPPIPGTEGLPAPRSWSPDGTRLVCDFVAAGKVFTYNFGSKEFDRVEGGILTGSPTTWLADSRRVLATARNGDLIIVDTQTDKSGVALSLQPDALMGRPFRDNRQIVFSRASAEGDIYMVSFK
jgi:hypothetical protein